MDSSKLFYSLGYNSLFSYMTQSLGLSEAITCNVTAVVRKSHEGPQLGDKVISGEISLSKARKLTPVITLENQEQWLKLAQVKTQKQIEREVALAKPVEAIVEKSQYVPIGELVNEKVQIKRNIPRLKLELGLSEKLMLKLRRCQDLESQKQRQHVNLENCLEALVQFYLDKKDPLKKAQRQKIRGKLSSTLEKIHDIISDAQASVSDILIDQLQRADSPNTPTKLRSKPQKRLPIPAKIKHQVLLRDEGRCTQIDKNGQRCFLKRFIEIHHQRPISEGGSNSLENLRLLCSGHHRAHHLINGSL